MPKVSQRLPRTPDHLKSQKDMNWYNEMVDHHMANNRSEKQAKYLAMRAVKVARGVIPPYIPTGRKQGRSKKRK